MRTVNIYSHGTIEPWNWTSPWIKGIGGSETCHIELAERFELKGYSVNSFAPMKVDAASNWKHSKFAKPKPNENWIVFRDPAFFDRKLPKGNYIFVAQDCTYTWTPERLAKITKYITLCKEHARFTINKHPELKDKVYISSNGVRTNVISEVEKENILRNPNKLIYASSPDRGLLLLLQNWFRIKERHRSAELHVFYGFNNMDEIIKRFATSDLTVLKSELTNLLDQKDVIWRGRIGQMELYREWFSSNVWWYPCSWPETSCITCMDAQACGAIPVTSDYWALKDNILHGYVTKENAEDCQIAKCNQIDNVIHLLQNPEVPWRNEMMQDARDTFNWDKIVSNYEGFLC